MKLYINTFGGLDIKSGEQSILKESNRTYRLYKLFQYFLTFRNKKILPETIIDNLWTDSESSDPKNVLRTQIFRIRKVIKTLLPEGASENKYININFVNGYYCLEIGENVVLDLDEFESLINLGDVEYNKDVENAIMLYENAIKLYKGSYLSENGYEVWIVPTRNYFQRLYFKTLYKLLDILKEKECYDKIIILCEEALLIQPYEEDIHMKLMEAMLKIGQHKSAMSHYEYTVLLLEKEMGAKPSEQFSEFLRKIQSNSSSKGEADIFSIKKRLDDYSEDGALHCEFDYFKFLYNAQKRKSIRNNEYDYLGLITLKRGENVFFDNKKLSFWSNAMIKILGCSLRKGDVFSFWNESQILIMLHDVRDDGIKHVEIRIRKNIENYSNLSFYHMSIAFQPLISENIAL